MGEKRCIVTARELEAAVAQLPPVRQWDEESFPIVDILIVALGFEDRALHVAQMVQKAFERRTSARISLALVACYSTNQSDNERNRGILESSLRAISDRIEYIDADSPQAVSKDLSAHVDKMQVEGPVKIALDISAASGTLILSAMHALLSRRERIVLSIFYTEPERYFPSREDYDRDAEHLVQSCCASGDPNSPHENGVEVVEVNELYPGLPIENRTEKVIAVPSFRTERLRHCLQYVSDQIQAAPGHHVLWLLGDPPSTSNRWRIDLQRRVVNRTMATMVGLEPNDSRAPLLTQNNSALVSTLDYRTMTQVIVKCADNFLGDRISVVHMGSKMQAVGLSLALQIRPEITVCYARPAHFNVARYSIGTATTWMVEFGHLRTALSELTHVGELKLTPMIETDRSVARGSS